MRFGTHLRSDPEAAMRLIGVSPEGIEVMAKKGRMYHIMLKGIPLKDAIILKQEALAVGGDCAVSWGVVGLNTDKTDALLIITERQAEILVNKMRYQPFNGKAIADEVERLILTEKKREYTLKLPGKAMKLPFAVMGILNVTPDSFSDGGRFNETDRAVEHAMRMVEEGAGIIDIGGESSRPGSPRVSAEEEWERIGPVIKAVRDSSEIPISVDTYKPEVAEKALNAGADMINDIYGLRKEGMADVIADHGAAVVIMHMQGDPDSMQDNPHYSDVVSEINEFLGNQAEMALDAGIDESSIVLDPGIGFGKTVEHNLTTIRELGAFRSHGYPVLLGASRKSFIGKSMGLPVDERLEASLAVAVAALERGASILRVHDVGETVRALGMMDKIGEIRGI